MENVRRFKTWEGMKKMIFLPAFLAACMFAAFLSGGISAKAAVEAPEYTLTAIDGTAVSTNGSGYKATVLVFGRPACGNTSSTLAKAAGSEWLKNPEIRVIFGDVDGASRDTIQAFADRIGSSEIIYCHYGEKGINNIMWHYVDRYYDGSSMPLSVLPFIVYVDGNNMIQDVTDGYKKPEEILAKIQTFADVSIAVPAPVFTEPVASELFDAAWYVQQNPDVAAAFPGASDDLLYLHYVLFGFSEGRLPYNPAARS